VLYYKNHFITAIGNPNLLGHGKKLKAELAYSYT